MNRPWLEGSEDCGVCEKKLVCDKKLHLLLRQSCLVLFHKSCIVTKKNVVMANEARKRTSTIIVACQRCLFQFNQRNDAYMNDLDKESCVAGHTQEAIDTERRALLETQRMLDCKIAEMKRNIFKQRKQLIIQEKIDAIRKKTQNVLAENDKLQRQMLSINTRKAARKTIAQEKALSLQESLFDDTIPDDLTCPKGLFNIFRRDRACSISDRQDEVGVCTFVNAKYDAKMIEAVPSNALHVEILVVMVNIHGKDIVIVNVYVAPYYTQYAAEEVRCILKIIKNQNHRF